MCREDESGMARYFLSADALCPFYRKESTMAVVCEGVTKDSRIRQEFRHGAANYKQSFCCADWKNCRVSRMLQEKYE